MSNRMGPDGDAGVPQVGGSAPRREHLAEVCELNWHHDFDSPSSAPSESSLGSTRANSALGRRLRC